MSPEREQQVRAAWEIGKQRRYRWGRGPMLVEPPGYPEADMVAFQLTAFLVDDGIEISVTAEGLRVDHRVLSLEEAAKFAGMGDLSSE